jgi:hypothetical protein
MDIRRSFNISPLVDVIIPYRAAHLLWIWYNARRGNNSVKKPLPVKIVEALGCGCTFILGLLLFLCVVVLAARLALH